MPNLPYISPEIIQAYQQEIARRSSKSTAKRKMSSLKRFFNWAQQNGHIEQNPIEVDQIVLPTLVQPSIEGEEKEEKRVYVSKKAILTGTFSVALAIIILLLVGRVKIPIPFRKAPASEGDITTVTTPTTEKPMVLSPWTLYARMKLTKRDGSSFTGTQSITFKIYKSEGAVTGSVFT